MYVYCIEMCIYWIHSTYILYSSICPLVVQSYNIWDEAVNPLISMKYTVVNRNSVFGLCHVFQERTPGIKRDLPVQGVDSQHNPQGEYKIIQPKMSSHFSERKIQSAQKLMNAETIIHSSVGWCKHSFELSTDY
jgi:hypothetical protein